MTTADQFRELSRMVARLEARAVPARSLDYRPPPWVRVSWQRRPGCRWYGLVAPTLDAALSEAWEHLTGTTISFSKYQVGPGR